MGDIKDMVPPLGFEGECWWPVGDYMIERLPLRLSRAVEHYSAPLDGYMAYVWGSKYQFYICVGKDRGPCGELEHRTRFVETSRRMRSVEPDPFTLKMAIIAMVEDRKNSGWE